MRLFVVSETLGRLLSIGAAIAVSDRNDGSDVSTRIHHYEIFAQNYFQTRFENFFWRPGFRVGYENLPKDDSPRWISVAEKTSRVGFELGLVYDGYLIPSITTQSAIIMRKLWLRTAGSVSSSSKNFERTEWLPVQAFSIGLGLPIEGGKALIEPFYRVLWIGGDSRQTSHWGIEFSLPIRLGSELQLASK